MPRDVDAAHAVGAIAVGVATGKYTIEQLLPAGADYALATLESPLPGIPELLVQAGVSAALQSPKGTSGCHDESQ